MDGVIGLIVFALISFAYNKLVERANKQKPPKSDLDNWLNTSEPKNQPQNGKKPKIDEQIKTLKTNNNEKIKEKYDRDKPHTDLSQYDSSRQLKQAFDKIDDPQTIDNNELITTKRISRKSLNLRNKKTLRQAFILNTILSKPKSYEQ